MVNPALEKPDQRRDCPDNEAIPPGMLPDPASTRCRLGVHSKRGSGAGSRSRSRDLRIWSLTMSHADSVTSRTEADDTKPVRVCRHGHGPSRARPTWFAHRASKPNADPTVTERRTDRHHCVAHIPS